MFITKNIDLNRLKISPNIEISQKSRLGQYLTSAPIAKFMASFFEDSWLGDIKLLDAGAGIGSLFSAFVERMLTLPNPNSRISIDSFEVDKTFEKELNFAIQLCSDYGKELNVNVNGNVYIKDFIEHSIEKMTSPLFDSHCELYSHAILNPPYKRIRNNSDYRKKLRLVGIETVNLYSAFTALAIKQLRNGGQLVSITPRSFCNGPYFKEFRKLLIREMGIKKIHIFESRTKAFEDDEVLQENIILHAVKGDYQSNVEISSSSDSNFDDLTHKIVEYEDIVQLNDKDKIINIPTIHQNGSFQKYLMMFSNSLYDIGLEVSTGTIVDFRAKEYLRNIPQKSTVPLIYPMHFKEGFIEYPQKNSKKPNAIVDNSETKKFLWPKGYYVLIKRFSSKEERRRIVASIYDPEKINSNFIGFENHLNVFHSSGCGLEKSIAKGLAVYLSSTFIDLFFRQFSGHTQVNVSDMKKLPYPSINMLKQIGTSFNKVFPPQDRIDEMIDNIINNSNFKGDNVVSVEKKIEEAIHILKELGFPKKQLNDRSGLTLLALLSLKPNDKWNNAKSNMIGITPIMDFCKEYYKRDYAPNTRETFRRLTMHQFVQDGLVIENPDKPDRPINSPKWCYRINKDALFLIQKYKTGNWEKSLTKYLSTIISLKDKYKKERKKIKIPVRINKKEMIDLTPGNHNSLIKKIIEDFGAIYSPGGEVLYVGDTGCKFGYFNKKAFNKLGIKIDTHGKMPDVVIYYKKQDWLILLEAVTSHGPVDSKRRLELSELFRDVRDKLIYVTCFLNKSDMLKYVSEISWETEVWIADNPTHIIHFNGDRFLGPYEK